MIIINTNSSFHLNKWLINFQNYLKFKGFEILNIIGLKSDEYYKSVISNDKCEINH